MRRRTFVVAVVGGALLLPLPTAADDLGGRQALVCANRLLEYLTDLPQQPHDPTLEVGLAVWFMGCTYYLPPAVGPVLNAMQADIEAIYRHRDELPPGWDIAKAHRSVVCGAWAAIYSNTYYGLLPEYGSAPVADLPTPDEQAAACAAWVEGQ